MTREQIIAAIDDEIGRLQQVKKLLQSSGGVGLTSASTGKNGSPKRILSVEARQRIAAAQKRRWAKQRKEAAASPKK
jgi:hypothetical protein